MCYILDDAMPAVLSELDNSSSLKDEQRVALKTFLYSWQVPWQENHGSHWVGDTSKPCAATYLLNWQKIWFVCYKCDARRFYPITFHVFSFILFCPQKYQNLPQVVVGLVPLSSIAVILCVEVTKTLLFNILFPHADKLDHVGRREVVNDNLQK